MNKAKSTISIDTGLLYPVASLVIEVLNRLNLVELFKFVASCVAVKLGSDRRSFASVAIDIFIVAKFSFIFWLWTEGKQGTVWIALVGYLLFFNGFTYFYHHVWSHRGTPRPNELHRIRRRFISLLLAVAFSVVVFAYLYAIPFSSEFHLVINGALGSLVYSIATTFFAGSGFAEPLSTAANIITLAQQFNSFIFITIILANSIPALEAEKGNE